MSKRSRVFWGTLVALLLVASAAIAQTVSVPQKVVAYADMVVYNGKVYTMDDRSTDPNKPGNIFQAMAVRQGEILALGADQEILSYAGPETVRVNLRGRTLTPGFINTHTHIHTHALAFYVQEHPEVVESVARLFEVEGSTDAELKKGIELVLKERMASAPKNQWALIGLPQGGRGSPGIGTKFLQARTMNRAELDQLTKNPVLLRAHPAYIVNTAALEALARIYLDEPATVVMSDAINVGEGLIDGVAYGRTIVMNEYFRSRLDLLADITYEHLMKNAALGMTAYSSHIQGLPQFDAFVKLVREDKMPIRFGWTNFFGFEGNSDPTSFYSRYGDQEGLGTDVFWNLGMGFGNIDEGPPMWCSSLQGPAEAKAREFCRNAPGTEFDRAVYEAIRTRQRIAVGHAWADKGLDYLFQTIERVMKEDPAITLDYIRSRRFSSDHCGLYPRPDQLATFKKYNWLLSCAGRGYRRNLPWLNEVFGWDPYENWIQPVKSIIDAGITVTFENEAFSHPLYPGTHMAELEFLLTRYSPEIGRKIAPHEAVDRVTLMKMMTTWGGEFMRKEDKIGTLEVGKWADFVVLSKDYFSVPEEEIPHVVPVMTVMGGKMTFLRGDFADENRLNPVGFQIKYANLPANDPYAAPPEIRERWETERLRPPDRVARGDGD